MSNVYSRIKSKERIEAIFKSENLTTIDKAKASLLTVLPLDKERLAIWKFGWRFAMTYMSTVKSTLDDGLDQLCNSILTLLKTIIC